MLTRLVYQSIFAGLLFAACFSVNAAGSGGINAPEQRDKPYLILVSLDGFRWDYQDLYETPAMDHIARRGIRAERLIPAFPTLTFPNHYSIATGLYPANHGLIGNTFPTPDRSAWYSISKRETVEDGWWYKGEPVWVAAEKAGMVTAAYFFVGTEADIQGIPVSHWNSFDYSVSGESRVEQVLQWLAMPEVQRPHFITLYFEDVDSATHQHGPGSKESVSAIRRVDGYLQMLLEGLDELPHGEQVYIIVVSDHGQAVKKSDEDILIIDEVVDTEGLAIVDHGAAAFIYLQPEQADRAAGIRDAINAEWEHGRAYLPEEAPASWQLDSEAGLADVIVQAELGYLVFSFGDRVEARSRGDHGWPPEAEEMHGIFLASGPGLPKGKRIGPLSVVDVYPLMMEILGLPVTTAIDGDPDRLVPLSVHD